ncbi:MAG TPA: hypothetical protein VIG36_05465, partial [Methylocystis sp.]
RSLDAGLRGSSPMVEQVDDGGDRADDRGYMRNERQRVAQNVSKVFLPLSLFPAHCLWTLAPSFSTFRTLTIFLSDNIPMAVPLP